MTEAYIRTAWARYMARTDLDEDIDFVWATARAMISARVMRRQVDLDAILADTPHVYLHAGLVYLHERAQDDEGLAREQGLLAQAIQDEALAWSHANVTPKPGATTWA